MNILYSLQKYLESNNLRTWLDVTNTDLKLKEVFKVEKVGKFTHTKYKTRYLAFLNIWRSFEEINWNVWLGVIS